MELNKFLEFLLTDHHLLLTIDLTEAVADEAIASKSDLIITYHPILFRPANRLDAGNAHDRTVMKLVQKNVAVYSPHTALDAVIGGVNDWLAARSEVPIDWARPGFSPPARQAMPAP